MFCQHHSNGKILQSIFLFISSCCFACHCFCFSSSVTRSVSVFQEEEMPEVEIDIDDLLEVNSDDERASKLQVYPCDCVRLCSHTSIFNKPRCVQTDCKSL